MPRLSQVAELQYLRWQDLFIREKPFQIFCDIPNYSKDQRHTNIDFEPKECTIKDVREYEGDFTLDNDGFLYIRHQSAFQDFEDPEKVKKFFYPEVEKLIKTHVEQADEVIIFDFRIRRPQTENDSEAMDLNDVRTALTPSPYVHCDQSAFGSMNKILHYTRDVPEKLLHGRVRIVNVWRPLFSPVEDWPLAVCDAKSIKQDDLIEVDNIRKSLATSALYAVYNHAHRWHYLSRQTPDEVLIHKQFDTADVPAIRCPHCAFQPHDVAPDRKIRESIELRVIILTNS